VGLNLAMDEQKVGVVIVKDKNRLIAQEAIKAGIKL
jgi:hypothetical protein